MGSATEKNKAEKEKESMEKQGGVKVGSQVPGKARGGSDIEQRPGGREGVQVIQVQGLGVVDHTQPWVRGPFARI